MRLPRILFALIAGLLATGLHAAEAKLGPEVPLSPLVSGKKSIDPQIVQTPRGLAAVWSDSGYYGVSASFGGTAVTVDATTGMDWIGWPAAAGGSRVILLVWWHNVDKNKESVLAQRFDFSGRPVDDAPLVLGEGSPWTSDQYRHTAPSIAFDGSDFLVAWAQPNPDQVVSPVELHTIRIGEEGPPFDYRETTVVAGGYLGVRSRSARAFWTGTDFLVMCSIEYAGHAGVSYDYQSMTSVRLDGGPAVISYPIFAQMASLSPGGIVAGGRITLVWRDYTAVSISGAQMSLDGTLITPPQAVVLNPANDYHPTAEIVWNGSEYVLVWSELIAPTMTTRTVRALRLDQKLVPIDAQPIEVSSALGLLSTISITATPEGAAIAYSRQDSPDTAVVVTRTLERLMPLSSRRRAAGR